MTYKFFDTCSLLLKAGHLFEDQDYVTVISSITLQEIENIKTSRNKDAEVKYSARKILLELEEHPNDYETYIFTENMLEPFTSIHLEVNNDIKILACAFDYDKQQHPDETVFVTNDLALKAIANIFFGQDCIESVDENTIDDYKGFKEFYINDEDLAKVYEKPLVNWFDCSPNEYILLKDINGHYLDSFCWTGVKHRPLIYKDFNSRWFGKVRPIKGDLYQAFAADSLMNNQITLITGPAGSGKSLLSLAYLMYKLDRGDIDKIIIFCNTVAVRDAARLGFYPGTREEKLLDSQIGNFLAAKFGGQIEVEHLIQQEKLLLLPVSDCRGLDTTGMRAGIYVTEAQNLTVDLMKLILQRVGEDSICVIEGDNLAQVDMVEYSGNNNGMRRLSQVFRGNDFFGQVELQTIHRSQIAELAQYM